VLSPEAHFIIKELKYSLDGKIPLFVGTYKTVYRIGAKKAARELIPTLNGVLETLKLDQVILNREQLTIELEAAIASIDKVDFQDDRFFKKHKNQYIRILKRLSRPDKPYSYEDFKADFQKQKRKEGILFKETDIRTAWDEVKEQYVLPVNPNLEQYKKVFDQVNPINQYGFPATKIYGCYNGQIELVYHQPKPINNGRKLPAFGSFKVTMNSEHLSGYRYLLYPDSFSLESPLNGEIKILSGVKIGPRMDHGFIRYYRMEENRLIETDHFTHWLS
jgi:hypothetical protein